MKAYIPPPPLFSKRPCLVSGGGGTVTFRFSNFLRRLDIEVLLCVCWLDKVLLLVHCCVLQISCMEGPALHPVLCRTFGFCNSAMNGIDMYSAGAVVNFQRADG